MVLLYVNGGGVVRWWWQRGKLARNTTESTRDEGRDSKITTHVAIYSSENTHTHTHTCAHSKEHTNNCAPPKRKKRTAL